MCRALVERGHRVRSFARNTHYRLDAYGVEQFRGDIRDVAAVRRATAACDAVVHCAAMAAHWGSWTEFWQINVTGTANVVAACRTQGVPRLVHTSTASVVFDGRSIEGAGESLPYGRCLDRYPDTKKAAEQIALRANDKTLATTALRPHLVWGHGDPHFAPVLAGQVRGSSIVLPGDGRNLIDTVHVVDAANAHALAVERLTSSSPLAGRPYFITQGSPRPRDQAVAELLAAQLGRPVRVRHLPRTPVMLMATAGEFLHRRLVTSKEPALTRFIVAELTTSHWFDISAARRDLGYNPRPTPTF
ncbi:NAD-dependent epimerase/dehydratase family protein [Streptomyces sp. PTM05]|uniref:NAD-dependent epimerase/dehydratase family protein n=1 Tax=Streptantibioticus parmotrematis TaxID=2873249 RepID=A0ABS7QSF4_9ACTN|nr:NAD-dependent epimerase/dehydratase family protein [Streptantibioticus parmotrematis]